MVMDMGLHAIPTLVEPQQMIQVLIPGVEERARHLPPLTSIGRLMPGLLESVGSLKQSPDWVPVLCILPRLRHGLHLICYSPYSTC